MSDKTWNNDVLIFLLMLFSFLLSRAEECTMMNRYSWPPSSLTVD
ncbi:MAG: hypothetical protein PHX16_03515 [Syntrophaceticus sp.]|nr:hypothetical protein [Syntrophaceticus sp.]